MRHFAYFGRGMFQRRHCRPFLDSVMEPAEVKGLPRMVKRTILKAQNIATFEFLGKIY
jgi:hypothetical protein